MSSIEAYRLAAALLVRGFEICPCRHGEPIPYQPRTPTDGALRGWYSDLNADGVGIVDPETGSVTIVDSVPLSAAELDAQRVAQEAELEARRKAEKRTKIRLEREVARRAKGITPRAQWLLEHSKTRSEPWKAEDVSKATYYRRLARATGRVESPNPGLRIQTAQSPAISSAETEGQDPE